jgi:hypothetical protein
MFYMFDNDRRYGIAIHGFSTSGEAGFDLFALPKDVSQKDLADPALLRSMEHIGNFTMDLQGCQFMQDHFTIMVKQFNETDAVDWWTTNGEWLKSIVPDNKIEQAMKLKSLPGRVNRLKNTILRMVREQRFRDSTFIRSKVHLIAREIVINHSNASKA